MIKIKTYNSSKVFISLPIQKLYDHFAEIHRSGYTVNLVHNLMKGSSDAWYQVWCVEAMF